MLEAQRYTRDDELFGNFPMYGLSDETIGGYIAKKRDADVWVAVNHWNHLPNANASGTRMRLCDFWSRNGNCLHGDSCKFYHDPSITPRPLQDTRTRPSDQDVRNNKSRDPHVSTPDRGRAQNARSPLAAANIGMHPSSPHLTGTSPGANSSGSGGSRRVCDFYVKYGNCRAGRACKFLHITPPSSFSSQQTQNVQNHQTPLHMPSEMPHVITGTPPVFYLSGSHGSRSSSESHSPLGALHPTLLFSDSESHLHSGSGSYQEPPQWNDMDGFTMDSATSDGKLSKTDSLEGTEWDETLGRGWGLKSNREVGMGMLSQSGSADMIDSGNTQAYVAGVGSLVSGGDWAANNARSVNAPAMHQQRFHHGGTNIGIASVALGPNPGAFGGNLLTPNMGYGVGSTVPVGGRAKWAAGHDGSSWFVTGDGWAHNAAGGRRRVCDFFDMKGNCRHGSACGFLHITRDVTPMLHHSTSAEDDTTNMMIDAAARGMGPGEDVFGNMAAMQEGEDGAIGFKGGARGRVGMAFRDGRDVGAGKGAKLMMNDDKTLSALMLAGDRRGRANGPQDETKMIVHKKSQGVRHYMAGKSNGGIGNTGCGAVVVLGGGDRFMTGLDDPMSPQLWNDEDDADGMDTSNNGRGKALWGQGEQVTCVVPAAGSDTWGGQSFDSVGRLADYLRNTLAEGRTSFE